MDGSLDSLVSSSASSPMQFLPMQPEFVDYHEVYVHGLAGLAEQHALNSMFVDEDPLQVSGVDPTYPTTGGDAVDGGDLDEAYRTQANILRMCLEENYPPMPPSTDAPSDYDYVLDTPMTAFPDLPFPLGLSPPPASFAPSPSASTPDECECPRCARRFASRSGLIRHVRTMHERPRTWYPCEVCGKGLASMASLRTHQYLHTDQRPFPCPDCPAGFLRARQLRLHREAKHPASGASTPSSFSPDPDVSRDRGDRGDLAHCGTSSRGSADDYDVVELDDDDIVELDVDEAGRREPSIVLRLTRCSDAEGQWRIVHLTKL